MPKRKRLTKTNTITTACSSQRSRETRQARLSCIQPSQVPKVLHPGGRHGGADLSGKRYAGPVKHAQRDRRCPTTDRHAARMAERQRPASRPTQLAGALLDPSARRGRTREGQADLRPAPHVRDRGARSWPLDVRGRALRGHQRADARRDLRSPGARKRRRREGAARRPRGRSGHYRATHHTQRRPRMTWDPR